jgi:uncharacterized protein YecE (DUF72 family)
VLWIERTPPDFTFNIKAYSLLTGHPTKVDSLYADLRERFAAEIDEAAKGKRNVYRDALPEAAVDEVWQRFRDALMPLHSAGKLGAVLFQFPQWFPISRANKEFLVECAERLPDYRVAVEFRNGTWMEERNAEETLGFLQEHRLPFVCLDMPQGFVSSIPPVVAATADDLALVRFHGRNRETWEKKGITAAERFHYLYPQEELEEWVPRIGSLREQARETHVLFNNCYRDDAVNNASDLAGLLEMER